MHATTLKHLQANQAIYLDRLVRDIAGICATQGLKPLRGFKENQTYDPAQGAQTGRDYSGDLHVWELTVTYSLQVEHLLFVSEDLAWEAAAELLRKEYPVSMHTTFEDHIRTYGYKAAVQEAVHESGRLPYAFYVRLVTVASTVFPEPRQEGTTGSAIVKHKQDRLSTLTSGDPNASGYQMKKMNDPERAIWRATYASAFVDAMRAGYSTITNGPFKHALAGNAACWMADAAVEQLRMLAHCERCGHTLSAECTVNECLKDD